MTPPHIFHVAGTIVIGTMPITDEEASDLAHVLLTEWICAMKARDPIASRAAAKRHTALMVAWADRAKWAGAAS